MRVLLSLPALGLLLPSLWQPESRSPVGAEVPALLTRSHPADLEGEVELFRAGCVACHAAPESVAERLEAKAAPSFESLGEARTSDALEARIRGHYVGEGRADRVRAIASFLRDENGRELESAEVSPAVVDRGEHLFHELACKACHVDGFAGLEAATDHRALSEFLAEPEVARPDLDHAFGLTEGEASSLSAYLLRGSFVTGAPGPGFQVECFEMPIANGDEPDLEGREPSFKGAARVVDVGPRTRDNNFALRFRTTLLVEQAGTHEFEIGSDDGSWLYIDDELAVQNPGLHPYTRVRGSVELEAGRHDLRLVFTEAGGGEELSLRWARPNGSLDEVPLERTSTRVDRLTPPVEQPLMDIGILGRGEDAYASLGCAACHGGPGERDLPDAPDLGDLDLKADCSVTPISEPVRRFLADLPTSARTDAEELAFEMGRASCLSCHSRGGDGGLSESVARELTETQDLGEEGRRPPTLDRAGYRFQTDWIRAVLADRADARPYMRARCVSVSEERAERIAAAFSAVDSVDGDEDEPEFSAEVLEAGRKQVGVTGKVCVSCHRVQGRDSLGPQGMDLSEQSERLKPAWFREWLLRPHEIRPGTRMPSFWIGREPEDANREIDAVRVWTNFGAAAPLPDGLSIDTAGYVVEVGERPRLHAAFLDGLSARCLLVGTPARVHYAYDLANARLRWLWRGAFVDGRGTWDGRAGKLVEPLGEDWIVLPENHGPIVGDGDRLRVASRRFDAEGHPVFVLHVAETRIEDVIQPRFEADGPVLIRRLTVLDGRARFDLADGGGFTVRDSRGQPVDPNRSVEAGETLEVIYRW